MLTDQVAALKRVEELLAAEPWRADRRDAWSRMLRAVVCAMDWDTGVVTGLTAAEIGAAGGRGARTVSDVLRWARDVGLLVVVEAGAAGAFLGSRTNRTPSYVLLADADLGVCDLPHGSVGSKPLPSGRRLNRPQPIRWPSWQVPQTPSERSAAVRALSRRISLDRPGVASWRLRPLLLRWWRDGWCVAGLLHALDHHPDRPDQARGDALRGAADPIRVLGHRLGPWRGRLAELPAHLVGRPGAEPVREPACAEPASASVREAAREDLARHLAELRARRSGRASSTPVVARPSMDRSR